ncbi:short-chain dehydrogenase-like protein, partial [Leptotrombidium deliense]
PGWTRTNIHKQVGAPDTIYDEKTKLYGLRRPGNASEIANVVCFAVSSKASFITGTSLVVDGGYTLNN